MFVEATLPSSFAHEENSFDDFSARPLLPLRESTMGPGLAAADLDGDFIDDLLLGAGKGGSLKGIKWQPDNPAEFASNALVGRSESNPGCAFNTGASQGAG